MSKKQFGTPRYSPVVHGDDDGEGTLPHKKGSWGREYRSGHEREPLERGYIRVTVAGLAVRDMGV